jgi:L-amino acid N-acyltransferase YncA
MNLETVTTVRDAGQADVSGVLGICAHAVATTVATFEDVAPTEEEMASRIEASHVWLIAEDTDGIAGYAYGSRFHPRAAYRCSTEVPVYVAERSQRRGVGHLLVDTVLGRLRTLGYVNAFAGITMPNPPASVCSNRWASRA